MKSIETVGILGLGKMGCPIAAHLVAKGFKVVGYDPLEEARNKAVALGARSAASARLAEKDLVLLDIPLARGEAAATAGKLLVYGAGDPDAFELCRPVFGAFASDIFHLGPAGAGQVAKMVNNLILWACISVNDEG